MSKRAFLGLLLLFLVTRAALVLSIADVFFYGDEVSKGGAAKALVDGVGLPAWQLNYVYHEGGGLLLFHLKALLFDWIGQSILVHKLAAILTSAVLLLVGCWLAGEHFGGKAAAIFGLFFVLCPESYARFSLLSLGTHFEALIPIALVLHFTMRILFRERASVADWAFLGLSSGLGLYVSLQAAPAIGLAALSIVLRLRMRLLGAGLLAAAAGLVLGAIPLWATMRHVGLAALTVQDHPRFDQGLRGFAALSELFYQLVREPDLWSWVWTAGYSAVIAAGFLVVRGPAGEALRSRCSFLLAYLALYLVLYAGSGFAVPHAGSWFFWLRASPVWFFSTVIFAACAAALLSYAAPRGGHAAPRWRELTVGILALLCVGGFADLASLLRRSRITRPGENWEILTKTKGYDLPAYFDKLVHHFDAPFADRAAVLLRFREEPEVLLPAITYSLFEHSGASLADALEFARSHLGPGWTTSAKGLGLLAAPQYGKDLPAAWAQLETAPAEARLPLAEAVGRVALGIKLTPEKIDEQVRLPTPPDLREPFLWGAGWRIHAMHRLHPELATELIEEQPSEVRETLREGYSRARRENTLP